MDSLLNSIAEILDAATAFNGDRAAPQFRAPSSAGPLPGLLFSADADGRVTAVDVLNSELGLETAALLAKECATALRHVRACVLTSRVPVPGWLAVGARRTGADGSILGCVLRGVPTESVPREEAGILQLALDAYAWAAAHWNAAHARLRVRIEQLQSEHHTLRASHSEAIAAAINEREERLREQQELVGRLQAVMMMAADGILTMDENGTVESFNEAAAGFFGYLPEEVVGRNIAMLLAESWAGQPEAAESQHAPVTVAARLAAMQEVTGRRRDGTEFPLESAVSEVWLGDRRIYTAILRDVTERKMLETQLRHAQKLESIGQLAAGIAHEINTPTQYISDNTRFLDDAFRDLSTLVAQCAALGAAVARGGDVSAAVAAVLEAAAQADTEYLQAEIPRAIKQSLEGLERVSKIVRSMKEFSHPGSQEMQAVDLNRAIESTLTISRNEWKYVADMLTDFDPQLPTVDCLPGEINQVVLNLIVNAAQAIADKVRDGGAERGTIIVRTRRDGEYVRISVTDTGTGIPAEIRGRIFDPFFTTKEVGRGTGQGLAIVHSVVTEKHGGTIHFETRPGEGTTFIVRLPLHPPKPLQRGACHET